MPLDKPRPPEEVRNAFDDGLGRLPQRTRTRFMTQVESGAFAANLVADPLEIFVMTAADAAADSGLVRATSRGWQYFVAQPPSEGSDPSRVAVVNVVRGQSGHQLTHIHRGWFPEATRRAIEAAERLPEAAGESFQLRVLALPSLLTDALWLKNTGQGADVILPIASADPAIKPREPYRSEDFLDAIRPLAANKVASDDRPSGA